MLRIVDSETKAELQKSYLGSGGELKKASYSSLKRKWLELASNDRYIKGNGTCSYVIKMLATLGAFEQAWKVPQQLNRKLDINTSGALLRAYCDKGSINGLVRVRIEMAKYNIPLPEYGDRYISQCLRGSGAPLSSFLSILQTLRKNSSVARTEVLKYALSSCTNSTDLSMVLTLCEEQQIPIDELRTDVLRACSIFGGLSIAKKWSADNLVHREWLLASYISAGSFSEPLRYYNAADEKTKAHLTMLYLRTCRHSVRRKDDPITLFAEKIFNIGKDIPSDRTLNSWIFLMNIYCKTRSIDAAEDLFIQHLDRNSQPQISILQGFQRACRLSIEGTTGVFGTLIAGEEEKKVWRERVFPPTI